MKIAARDNAALNQLYRNELQTAGVKTASEENIQAFKDHEEYEAIVADVLSEDSTQSWDPNDPILD